MSPACSGVPDRSRLVGSVGARVFVTDIGASSDEPPLVLLHDVLQCGFAFDPIARELAASRRVIVVDLPGAGESDRPAPEDADDYAMSWLAGQLADTLAQLDVGAACVLGQGFGAAIAIAFSIAHPRAVQHLVAIAPPLSGMALPHELRLARLLGELVFERAYRRADLRRTLAGWLSSPELVSELAIDVYWDRLARRGGLAAARAMLLQLERLGALAEAARALAVPVTLVWGDRDRVVPPVDAERWREILPSAEVELVEGCGHAVAEERPDLVAELVARPSASRAGQGHG